MKRLGYENTPFAFTSLRLISFSAYHSFATFVPIQSYSSSSPSRVVPEISYSNADTLKESILNENKSKSGIYRFTNTINGKSYIGSAINLSYRFHQYYSYKFLSTYLSSRKSYIYSSLLKNGYSNFKLEILEYCKASDVIAREQFYITSLCPEYNILQTAGSRFGSKHTVEAKAKMSVVKKGKPSMFLGKEHSEESKKKLSLSTLSKIKVQVTDLETNITISYNSMTAAAIALNIRVNAISKYFSQNQIKPYRGRYVFVRK